MKIKICIVFLALIAVNTVFAQDPCLEPLPFTEDFESADTIPQDNCWTDVGTIYTGSANYSPWDIYFGSNKSAYAEFWQGQPGDLFMLTTPPFDFTNEAAGELTFDWQSNGASHSSGDYFKVKLSTDGGTTFTTVWFKNGDNMQGGTCSSNTWPNGDWESSGEIPLPGVAGEDDIVILFEMYEDPLGSSSGRVFIDNIEVVGVFVNNVDAEVSATNIASLYDENELVSPTVDVVNNGDSDMTVDVTLVINDGSSDIVNETVSSVVVATGATETVAFSDWTAVVGNYTYSASVSDPGGDTDLGNNEITGEFEVLAEGACVFTLPYTEDFEAADTIPQGVCWSIEGTIFNGPDTYGPWDIYFGSNKSAFAEFWQGQPGDIFMLATPTFDFSNESAGELTFDWQSNGASHSSRDYFKVKLSTDDGATYSTVWFKNGDNMQGGTCSSNTWPNGDWESSGVIALPAVAGEDDVVILFEMYEDPNGSSSGRVFIDNIQVTAVVNNVDAEVSATNIESFYPVDEVVTPTVDVTNNGDDDMTVDVGLIFNDGSSDVVNESVNSVVVASGETETVIFTNWTAVTGNYTYTATVSDPGGDINLENNELTGEFYVSEVNIDAEASATNIESIYIADEIVSPTVDATNNGDNDMTVDVTLVINDGTSDVVNETVSSVVVAPGETETVAFSDWTAVIGNYTFTASVSDPGGDINLDNNEITGGFEVVESGPCVYELPYTEDFESADTIPQDECWSIEGTIFNGPETYAPWDIYFGTNKSAFAEYWQGMPGDLYMLTTPTFDFSNEEGGELTFEWQSYGASHSSGDYFKVKLSTDGGDTYNTVWYKNGDNMQGGTCSSNTWPDGDWESSGVIALPEVAGQDEVKILFEMYEDPNGSSSGRVFIDNVYVNGIIITVDAQVSATNIVTYYTEGDLVSPTVDATNLGNIEMTVDVTLVINDGNSNIIDETVSSVVVAAGATETVEFPDWTATLGNYTSSATVSDPGGDVNLDNNELTGVFDVGTVSVNEIENNVVRIYPNPSKGMFIVEITSDLRMDIVHFTGKTVNSVNLLQGSTTIEINKSGMYFLRFSNGIIEKVIVK